MNKAPVFREIEAGSDLSALEPGFYTVGCSGRFPRETVDSCLGCGLPDGFASGCFMGLLLPYFLHNVNNLMVGVVGNLDLASMFMPEMEKVVPKLTSARAATGSVVDFIRDIALVPGPSSGNRVSRAELEDALTLIKAACGRSVSTEGLEALHRKEGISCRDPLQLLNVLRGMGAWCVMCMGGSGRLSGSTEENRLSLSWVKPRTAGRSHMPGADTAPGILCIAGGLAVSAGYRLVVENWTDMDGKVTLAFE